MSSWETLLQTAEPERHLVQLYQSDERVLTRNVTQYLLEGLKRGDGLLVIATAEHCQAFIRCLKARGADPDEARLEGRLVILDAHAALAGCMAGGQPDRGRFEKTIGALLWEMRARAGSGRLRAFGEMVGILWRLGQCSAAIRIEQFWNRLLGKTGFSLLCAYPIDVFSEQFQTAAVNALLCAHTHLLPAVENGDLESAINLALDEIVGAKAAELKQLMDSNYRPSWGAVPKAEAMALWLRDNLPDMAGEILDRARQYCVTSHLRSRPRSDALAPNLTRGL